MSNIRKTINCDWGEASPSYDDILKFVSGRDLSSSNEAQTRFDVIDRFIREVLSWQYGQISVEEVTNGPRKGYIDYILSSGDSIIVVEAKKVGAAFPSPTRKKQLKLNGSVLGSGEIARAIKQAHEYALNRKADIVVVTNGLCWCFYAMTEIKEDSYAYLFFPFERTEDAETLFNYFAVAEVEKGSVRSITNALPRTEDRLISIITDADARVDRNNLADHIVPALNNSLYADAL